MIVPNSFFTVNYTSNISKLEKFWGSLGMQIIETSSEKLVIDLGGFEIHYILDKSEPFLEYKFATEEKGRGIGILNYFQVENIEVFFEKVKLLNPDKITDIKENHWESREFMFSDPDGFIFVAYK